MAPMVRWILAGATLAAAQLSALAAEVYVDASSVAATELGTQQSPFRTVQAAINAAGNGDEIRVAAGTYRENLRVQSKLVVLRGGYSSAWVRDLDKYRPTVSGAGGDCVITLIQSDATIDGFRITGGTGSTEDLPNAYNGGGIFSRDGSPTISNNIIEGNDLRSTNPPPDYNMGGGVYLSNVAKASILNNVIRSNFAGRGAGIAVGGQSVLIQGNTVENNVAVGDHGGGMFIGVVDAKVTQNVIRGNEVGRALTYGWGGGLIIVGAGNSAELSFNVLYQNFAAGYGAAEFVDEGARADIHHELIYSNLSKDSCEAVSAISVDGGEGVGSQVTIRQCTVVNNVCPNSVRGNGLQVEGLSTASVSNCIFWNNGGDDFAVAGDSSLTVTYTCSQEPIAGTGNFSADPMFVNASANDYHLAAGSPCIDAGDPASPFADEPAPNGGRADLGRYGNAGDATQSPSQDSPTGGANSGNANGGGAVDNSTSGNGGAGVDDTVLSGGTLSSTALCPMTAAMLFSLSLIGARRTPRKRVLSTK
ncbi:MAG: right-handed parallel beta-helix repeat-containing protein [Phycisphaerae bacterium]